MNTVNKPSNLFSLGNAVGSFQDFSPKKSLNGASGAVYTYFSERQIDVNLTLFLALIALPTQPSALKAAKKERASN